MDTWGIDPQSSPLAGDWSSFFQSQIPQNVGWWASDASPPYGYDQGWSRNPGFDYHPGGRGDMYDPESSFGWQSVIGGIDSWMMREHPELFDFSSQWQAGGVGSVGTVAKDPSFGQFNKDPRVYGEIQAAAQKYGVPANFLQAIIARESSGDWERNNWLSNIRPNSGPLMPYIGVFKNAADSWGVGHLWQQAIGNRALQIEILAGVLRGQYDKLHGQNPSWGWLNVASYHYSGNPVPTGWQDESGNGTDAAYMRQIESWWKRLDQMAGNTWSNFSDIGQSGGMGSPQNQKWAPVNRYDSFVASAAQKYGVPANLIKAVMQFESSGNPNAVSPQGATGLMQVMPFHVNGNRAALYDPMTNIDVGTRILMENYRQYGTWEMAAKAYLGFGVDAMGSTPNSYWARVKSNWDELNANGSGMFGGATGGSGGMSLGFEGIWGGVSYGVSQENGEANSWTAANPRMYAYGAGLGITNGGHPGMDITFPRGTKLYSPVSGTVISAGGTGSYGFYNQDRSGVGELRILLDNGHQVILGHMMNITVLPNQRVTAGMPVGVSGGFGSGDHLHLEYRIPGQQTSTGWRSVDPRQYITGGIVPGSTQQQYTGLGSSFMPMTFSNLMLAAAKGMTIPQGGTYASGGGSNSWNAYLRGLMAGRVPRTTPYTYTGPRGTDAPVLTGNE